MECVSGELSMAEAIETGKQYGMNLTAPVYGVMLFKVFGGTGKEKQPGNLVEVCERLEEIVEKTEYAYSFQRGVDGWAYLLTAEDERQMEERIRNLARQIKELMDGYREVEYFGGIGSLALRLRELPKAFADADHAFSGRFISALNQFVKVGELKQLQEPGDFEVKGFGEIERTRTSVEKFLNNGTQEEVESFARAYVDAFS